MTVSTVILCLAVRDVMWTRLADVAQVYIMSWALLFLLLNLAAQIWSKKSASVA